MQHQLIGQKTRLADVEMQFYKEKFLSCYQILLILCVAMTFEVNVYCFVLKVGQALGLTTDWSCHPLFLPGQHPNLL